MLEPPLNNQNNIYPELLLNISKDKIQSIIINIIQNILKEIN